MQDGVFQAPPLLAVLSIRRMYVDKTFIIIGHVRGIGGSTFSQHLLIEGTTVDLVPILNYTMVIREGVFC